MPVELRPIDRRALCSTYYHHLTLAPYCYYDRPSTALPAALLLTPAARPAANQHLAALLAAPRSTLAALPAANPNSTSAAPPAANHLLLPCLQYYDRPLLPCLQHHYRLRLLCLQSTTDNGYIACSKDPLRSQRRQYVCYTRWQGGKTMAVLPTAGTMAVPPTAGTLATQGRLA